MPPSGHRSITIRNEDYEYFLTRFKENKKALNRRGVRSFSAFVTMKLYTALESEEKTE